MSTTQQKVHDFVRENAGETASEETISWRVALFYADGCRESYDRGDWAHELISGAFTIEIAYEMLSDQIDENPEQFALCWQESFGA